MLTFRDGQDVIAIRFIHKTFESFEVEGLTGRSVDEDRRGSIAIIYLNSKEVSRGASICHPCDNFCRSLGRKKALADALYSYEKKFRTLVWREYEDVMSLQDTSEYIMVADDHGDYYVIPSNMINEWSRWVDSQEYLTPPWCKKVGGSMTLVKFKDYHIDEG